MVIANLYSLKFNEIVGDKNAEKIEEFLKDYFKIVDIIISKIDDTKFEIIKNQSILELKNTLREMVKDKELSQDELNKMLENFKEFNEKVSQQDKLRYKFSIVNDILKKIKIKDIKNIIEKINKNENYTIIFDEIEFTFNVDELKKIYEVLEKYNMLNDETIDFFKNKQLWNTNLFPSLLILLSQNDFKKLFYFILANLNEEIKKIDDPDIQEIILKAYKKKELYYYEVNKFLGYIFLTKGFNNLTYSEKFGNKSTYVFLALNTLYEKFKKNNLKKEFEAILNLKK